MKNYDLVTDLCFQLFVKSNMVMVFYKIYNEIIAINWIILMPYYNYY